MEPQHARACAVHIGGGKHFAADLPWAYPVHQAVPPVEGFHHMRRYHANFADALVVHASEYWRNGGNHPLVDIGCFGSEAADEELLQNVLCCAGGFGKEQIPHS